MWNFLGGIQEMLLGVFLLIDRLVYSLISWLYQLFCILASFNLFNNNMYESITKSIYIIIGVIALFLIAYQLLNSLIKIDDNKVTGDVKKSISNLITSLVLIAIVPTIFEFLFAFQNSILMNNTIGKIILPSFTYDNVSDAIENYGSEDDISQALINSVGEISEEDYNYYLLQYYGNSTAALIFQSFFYPANATVSNFNEEASAIETAGEGTNLLTKVLSYGSCGVAVASSFVTTFATAFIGTPTIGASLAYCAAAIGVERVGNAVLIATDTDKYPLSYAYNYAAMTGDFSVFQPFSQNVIDGEITYHYIISTIVGAIVVYVLAIYCIDLGVRSVKLAFYQILAPIPIMLRVAPKQDKVFNSWVKATLSTYLEVFVRMIVLYFGVFLISNIPAIMSNIFGTGSTPYANNALIYLLTRAILILGILIFVRQFPKILEDITGIKSGNFSLRFMDHLKEAAWAPAFIGGTIAGRGNPLAGIRAASQGWKDNNLHGIGAEVQRRRKREEARENGSRWYGRMAERGRRALGLENGVEAMDRQIKEGINPETGQAFAAQNDTRQAIQIRDADGRITTVAVGSTIDMDAETQEQIALTKQYNAQIMSGIDELIRQIDGSSNSNNRLINYRSEIKKEALDKIAENHSTITDTINVNGHRFTGNLAGMQEYLARRRLDGADETELQEITRQIGEAQDRMWQDYASQAIAGTINNGKIAGLSRQVNLAFAQDALQIDAGVAYDRVTDTLGLAGLTGLDLVNALDAAAKNFNNNLNIQKDTQTDRKARTQEQTTGLDRLTAQLTEQQELSKHGGAYRARRANVDSINNNNNGGGSQS